MTTKYASSDAQHMFLLVHGIFGSARDFDNFAPLLHDEHPSSVILVPNCMKGHTRKGVKHLSELLYQYVKAELIDQPHITHISIIAHSLGGLVSRVLIKKLSDDGTLDVIKPVVFGTVATPHLGTRQHNRVYGDFGTNMVMRHILGKTGVDFNLLDKPASGIPLLVEMASQPYIDALARFQYLYLWANAHGDYTVHYSTASCRKRNEFTDRPNGSEHNGPAKRGETLIVDDDHEEPDIEIVDPEISSSRSIRSRFIRTKSANKIRSQTFARWYAVMHNSLNTLPWKRFAMKGHGFRTHNDIIGKHSSRSAAIGIRERSNESIQHIVNTAVKSVSEAVPATGAIYPFPTKSENDIRRNVLKTGHFLSKNPALKRAWIDSFLKKKKPNLSSDEVLVRGETEISL